MLEAFIGVPRHANLPASRSIRPLSFLRRLRGQAKWPYVSPHTARKPSFAEHRQPTPHSSFPPKGVPTPHHLPTHRRFPKPPARRAAAVHDTPVECPPIPYIYDGAARLQHDDEVFAAQFKKMQIRSIDKRALTRCRAAVQTANLDSHRAETHSKRDANQQRLLRASHKRRLFDLTVRRRMRMLKVRAELERRRKLKEKAEMEKKKAEEKKRKDLLDDAVKKQRERVKQMRNPFDYPPSPSSSPLRRPRLPMSPPATPLKGKSPIPTQHPPTPMRSFSFTWPPNLSAGDRIARYERLWDYLTPLADASLAFKNIPWPALKLPNSPADITKDDISKFLFHPLRLQRVQDKGKRAVIREELRRWHPDKFCVRVLEKVNPSERALVWEAAEVVIRYLNELKNDV